jgi:hypothetical protein
MAPDTDAAPRPPEFLAADTDPRDAFMLMLVERLQQMEQQVEDEMQKQRRAAEAQLDNTPNCTQSSGPIGHPVRA